MKKKKLVITGHVSVTVGLFFILLLQYGYAGCGSHSFSVGANHSFPKYSYTFREGPGPNCTLVLLPVLRCCMVDEADLQIMYIFCLGLSLEKEKFPKEKIL